MSGSIWERFTHDPRHEENARLRAADRDRDVVNDVLGTAYSEGRLTAEELDERTDRVAAAKTLGELPAMVDDLVSLSGDATPVRRDDRAEAERRYREQRQRALWNLTPALICWIIWISVLAGHGFQGGVWFPWPVFVTLGTGRHYFQLATNKADSIENIQRDLEKKERKRLEQKQRKQVDGPADDPEMNQG
jgi:hypothetical protein